MVSPRFSLGELDHLQESWSCLHARLATATAAHVEAAFADLVARYSEPHRHYHNLQHIADVLAAVAQLSDLAVEPEAIELAVWYHDAIYDPRAKDNEERSAELAFAELSALGLLRKLIEKVAALIRATEHVGNAAADIDTQILLDADLAILGAEPERYRQYADAIRQEYAWVDHAAYRAGRSRLLESFQMRDRIYRTDQMFAAREEAARKNLRAELEQLNCQATSGS
jgi:predicted metal-dependent HD superfamily phosphohydrolase